MDSVISRIEEIVARVKHRLWPVPSLPWIMFQSWQDLLFASWPLPALKLQLLVPRELEIDTFERSAWVSLVPFRMVDLHFRDVPPLPGDNSFPELNFRTYVKVEDRPGVYFFSIECSNVIADWVARHFFSMPFMRSKIKFFTQDGSFVFESTRAQSDAPAARFVCNYRPIGEPFQAQPGSLEAFLVERYSLFFVKDQGAIYRGDIQHSPWNLQEAAAEFQVNTIATAAGIELPVTPPHLLFSSKTDTLVWPVVRQH